VLQSILDWVDPTGPSRPVSGSVPHLRWEQVGLFLALAFGLTWLLDLLLWLAGGLRVPAATLVLQVQMLLPAFSAILLGLFFFANSPLHVRTNRSPARLFLYYYLFLTVVYVAFALASVAAPQLLTMTGAISLLLSVLGLLLAIVLRFVSGRPAAKILGALWSRPGPFLRAADRAQLCFRVGRVRRSACYFGPAALACAVAARPAGRAGRVYTARPAVAGMRRAGRSAPASHA